MKHAFPTFMLHATRRSRKESEETLSRLIKSQFCAAKGGGAHVESPYVAPSNSGGAAGNRDRSVVTGTSNGHLVVDPIDFNFLFDSNVKMCKLHESHKTW